MARRPKLPSFQLRERTSADDYFLADLCDDAFAEWSRDPTSTVFSMLSSPKTKCLVAESGGEPVGFVVVEIEALGRPFGPWKKPVIARIDAIAVSLEARRAGVGRRLLAGAESLALREGAVVVRLRTAAQNGAAQRLFANAGYFPLLRVPRGYANGDSAIEMIRLLEGV
ncbi:MAG: GNAT family N-acetyltransferase [Polyangiaceae bacterium]